MTKEEKYTLVADLTESFRNHPNFLVFDTGGMSVESMNMLRRTCFNSNIKIKVVKNSLIKKALENLDSSYQEVFSGLKQNSTVIFANENFADSAKLVREFRKDSELPKFKLAYVEQSVFLGEENFESVCSIKSKQELIGEVIGLLQSPMTSVVGALQSGGQTVAGVLKTLSEKNQ